MAGALDLVLCAKPLRYRAEPSPLVRNLNGEWGTGRLDAVLGGDFDLLAASLRERGDA